MPGGQQIAQLLPLILKFFPELRVAPAVGKIIPIFNIASETDAQQLKDIERAIKRQLEQEPHDKTSVVKVSDALDCIKNRITASLLKAVVSGVIDVLKGSGNISTELFSPIAKCIREKQLRQDTPRVVSSKKGPHRPARGHGKGR